MLKKGCKYINIWLADILYDKWPRWGCTMHLNILICKKGKHWSVIVETEREWGGGKSNSSLALSFWSLHMADKQVPGRWLRRLMQISYQLLLLSLGENFGCFFAMLDTCELLRLSNVPITVVMLLTVSIEIFYCVFFHQQITGLTNC